MSLEATSGFRLLDNFRGQGLVFKEILKRPYSGFCENGRIWSIMIWSYCLYYVYTIPWTICLWNSKLYQPLTPQFHIDIPWKSANKNSTLTHQSERWCPPQPTIDFESNKTASCYQMLFNKHMSHEQWTKTWLCRVYRKSYCPVLWGIMINITIRIQWSLSKTTSIMESIRVCCRWLTSHHMIGVVTPGTSRLKDASHEPFTFRWGNPVENISKVVRRTFFYGIHWFQRFR